jgi:hypothetical protein
MADDTQQDEGTQPEATDESATDDLGDPGKKALEAERAARKEAEKARKALERELEQVRTANLSDAERAVAEAEARGRTAAMSEFGQRLVRSDFVAEAARRNPEFNATDVLDDLNFSRFVGEDGEPDAKAIAKAVERLVPLAGPRYGNADQGPRTSSSAPDFNAELRRAAGRG